MVRITKKGAENCMQDTEKGNQFESDPEVSGQDEREEKNRGECSHSLSLCFCTLNGCIVEPIRTKVPTKYFVNITASWSVSVKKKNQSSCCRSRSHTHSGFLYPRPESNRHALRHRILKTNERSSTRQNALFFNDFFP
jgi:hypothetical protein